MTPATTPLQPGRRPTIGYIGWGPESAAMLETLQARYPGIADEAVTLAAAPRPGPLGRTLPSLEALFQSAEIIFAEGGQAVLEPHLPMVRLAISDRNVLVLLGAGWSVESLLHPLKERKLARCMLLPGPEGGHDGVAFYAAPYFAPEEREAFRDLFAHLGLCIELEEEAHFEVLHGLADFAPAALYTVLEAMADGVVMLGFSRSAALRFLASLLQGAARRIIHEDATASQLRERALEIDVAAAGLIELESAGIRGTMMRAVQRAVGHSRRGGASAPPPTSDEDQRR